MRRLATLTVVLVALVATALLVVVVVVGPADEHRDGSTVPDVAADRTVHAEPSEQREPPQHLVGEDGWLYLRATVAGACDDSAPVAGVLAETRRAARVAAAADLRFVALVPPDKAAVFPEHLGRSRPLGDCLLQRAAELTEGTGPDVPLLTGYAPLRAAALDGGELRGELAYHRRDSHWRAAGALELSLQLHELLAPSAAARLEAVPGELHLRPQDLERFATGAETDEPERRWSLEEPGTTTRRQDPDPVVPETVGLRIDGGTQPFDHLLVIRDSFGELMLDQLAPLATTSHFCRCTCECLPAALGPSLERADVLVWQNVQRGSYRRMVGGRLAGQLATLLGDRLPTTPLDVTGTTVVVPQDGVLRLRFAGDPPATVTVTDADRRTHVLTTKGGTLPSLLLDEVAAGPATVSSDGELLAAEHAPLRGGAVRRAGGR